MNRKIVKKRLVLKKNIRQFLIRCMLTVIIVLITLIAIKTNNDIKKIITKRFFDGRTQMEVADEIGISQAQVSRLEKTAIDHIRRLYK